MIYGSSGVVTPGVREASLPTAEGHHGHLVGLDGCQWHIAATGERGIVATMSENRFACVRQLAVGTDSLDQEEIAVFWDGENLHLTKGL